MTTVVLVFLFVNVLCKCLGHPHAYLPLEVGGSQTREEIIQTYFKMGFHYAEIVAFLCLYHGITIGVRQLKRILRAFGLRRRTPKDDVLDVFTAINFEINNTGGDLGYRAMHNRLKKIHNIIVDKETVRLVMKQLDPEGVEFRRRHRLKRRQYHVPGPNYLWHIDGWDKLKPYGICIHGCIDGFSRRIMWLEVAATNNDPFVICKYFADCIYKLQGCPAVVRADRGTENVNVELLQSFLRRENADNASSVRLSFLYGKSTANQRIEGWWSKFKSAGMGTFVRHFRDLVDNGIIDTSNDMDIECVRFCFIALIRKELQNIMMLWNTHHIRKIKNSDVPSGKPDIMYHFPDMFGGFDCLKPVSGEELAALGEMLTTDSLDYNSDKAALFIHLMEDGSKLMPNTLDEATNLLAYLLDTIECNVQTMDI